MMLNTIKQSAVYKRLDSDTPSFFKRVRFYAKIGMGITTVAIALTASLTLPAWIPITIGIIDAMCATAIALSSATTTSEDISKKDFKPSKFEEVIKILFKKNEPSEDSRAMYEARNK